MESIKTKSELIDEFKDRFYKIGFSSSSTTAIYPRFINAIVEPLSEVYDSLRVVQDESMPTRATGNALDIHGLLAGVDRLTGSVPIDTSGNNVYVFLTNGTIARDITTDGLGILIPAGTRINGSSVPFFTVANAYIAPDANGTFVNVIGSKVSSTPIMPGSLTSISIDYDTINNLSPASMGTTILAATNTKIISGGSYIEVDSDYKNRMTISNATYHQRMRSAIEYAVYSVPGVVSMDVRANTHGVGTQSIVIIAKDIMASDSLILAVQQKIDELGDSSVRVMRPDYVTVSLINKIMYSPEYSTPADITNTNNLIITAQKIYVNNLKNGEKLSLSSLEEVAKNAAGKYITNLSVSCLKINNRYVALTDQIAGWDEKFMIYDDIENPAITFVQ